MKPLPAPNVPGKTEFERFDNAMRKVLAMPRNSQTLSPPRPSKKEPKK
jgi:hypothetical protein